MTLSREDASLSELSVEMIFGGVDGKEMEKGNI